MTAPPSTGSAICSLDEFLQVPYDYIIVGGGTAGLAVAARLTEDPGVTVGVIEAGSDQTNNELVQTPALFPQMLGIPEYDWMLETVPQVGGFAIQSCPAQTADETVESEPQQSPCTNSG